MVSYSFKRRFSDPILLGLGLLRKPLKLIRPKRQTVRLIGKKRHARRGEYVQLYTDLRTKKAIKLGDAVCTRTAPIRIEFEDAHGPIDDVGVYIYIEGGLLTEDETLTFAYDDGFLSIGDFVNFWEMNQGISKPFKDGIIIYWEPEP